MVPSRLPTSWVHEFERGASLHGNWAACVEAEQTLERFIGGQPCPHRCGSIIRYQVGRPRQESVRRHEQNPAACRKHPQHRKARRRARSVAPSPSQVP